MRRCVGIVVVTLAWGCSSSSEAPLPAITVSDAGPATSDLGPSVGERALAYVDPLIGTGGTGFQYAGMTPAVQVPNGLVKLGPDTTASGNHPAEFHHFSGYYANDPDIRGFSHLHFVGTGTTDYGNLRVSVVSEQQLAETEPWLAYSEKVGESELAAPGYYAVELANGARAELTTTKNAGLHRYRVPAGGYIAFDAASAVDDEGVLEVRVEVAGDGTIEGFASYAGSYIGRRNPLPIWFSAKATPPDSVAVWDDEGIVAATQMSGAEVGGALLRYDDATDVELVVGVSTVSAANARAYTEVGSFDEVRAENEQQWADLLDRIDFGELSDEELTLNYTALYNCFRMPTRFDEDGQYRGLDGELHEVDHAYYTDLSLWDTYRTLHPLLTLVYPEVQRDVLRSLVLMSRDGGYMPRWPAAVSYTGGMEGEPAAMLFAEGALGGIEGVDYDAAFGALEKTANGPVPEGAPYGGRGGIADYLELGWVPADRDGAAASNTLEYPIADNAMANLAEFLGRDDATYRERAQFYRNGWDAEEKFFRPRNADGSWVEPFSFKAYNDRSGYFAEGSAWHYRFHVLHDPEGLVELFGGEAALGDAIEEFMEGSRLWSGHASRLAVPDPFYWHGNEPPLHTAQYLAFAGRWDRLTHWVGEIREHAYSTEVDGLAGNDDGGTLSAWYVLSSLGLYPVVGTDRWIVHEPLVPDVRVDGVTFPGSRSIARTVDLRR